MGLKEEIKSMQENPRVSDRIIELENTIAKLKNTIKDIKSKHSKEISFKENIKHLLDNHIELASKVRAVKNKKTKDEIISSSFEVLTKLIEDENFNKNDRMYKIVVNHLKAVIAVLLE